MKLIVPWICGSTKDTLLADVNDYRKYIRGFEKPLTRDVALEERSSAIGDALMSALHHKQYMDVESLKEIPPTLLGPTLTICDLVVKSKDPRWLATKNDVCTPELCDIATQIQPQHTTIGCQYYCCRHQDDFILICSFS